MLLQTGCLGEWCRRSRAGAVSGASVEPNSSVVVYASTSVAIDDRARANACAPNGQCSLAVIRVAKSDATFGPGHGMARSARAKEAHRAARACAGHTCGLFAQEPGLVVGSIEWG